MSLSEKAIKDFQEVYKKKNGKELPYEEAADATNRLAGLFEILIKSHFEDLKRKEKLKEFPKGYAIEGEGRTCPICGHSMREKLWYDKYGFKCMICQGSVNRKEIPGSTALNRESWYSKYDLESDFNLKGPKLRSWIKQGIIKARTVTHDGKGCHVQLFLIKDNKDFLPPKKLVKSQLVKVTKEGQDWYHSEPWYKFVDPFKHLKGYKIMDHMQIVEGEDIKEKMTVECNF